MKNSQKQSSSEDVYDRAFNNSVDTADKIGQKIGYWTKAGGWKILAVTVTVLSILFFGGIELLKGIGRGMVKSSDKV